MDASPNYSRMESLGAGRGVSMEHLRDAMKMVRYVSNLDTSQQATDLLDQSTMEENYE